MITMDTLFTYLDTVLIVHITGVGVWRGYVKQHIAVRNRKNITEMQYSDENSRRSFLVMTQASKRVSNFET